jgi:hypothetical protein
MNLDQITLKGPPGWPATLTVEPGGEAAFTLHSPDLGAVEVRIRLDAAGVRAAVTTLPGPVTERAAAALPDLVAALEGATGRAGIASVQSRRGSKSGPTPAEGAYDGYA